MKLPLIFFILISNFFILSVGAAENLDLSQKYEALYGGQIESLNTKSLSWWEKEAQSFWQTNRKIELNDEQKKEIVETYINRIQNWIRLACLMVDRSENSDTLFDGVKPTKMNSYLNDNQMWRDALSSFQNGETSADGLRNIVRTDCELLEVKFAGGKSSYVELSTKFDFQGNEYVSDEFIHAQKKYETQRYLDSLSFSPTASEWSSPNTIVQPFYGETGWDDFMVNEISAMPGSYQVYAPLEVSVGERRFAPSPFIDTGCSYCLRAIIRPPYIVPLKSYNYGKALPVPVGRFEVEIGNAGPKYKGGVKEILDFSGLFLASIPDETYLLRLMNQKEANQWKDYLSDSAGNLDSINVGSMSWDNSVEKHGYISNWRDQSVRSVLEYQILPKGSLHFMANSLWQGGELWIDQYGTSYSNVLAIKITKESMINLQKHGHLWVNSYDGYEYEENGGVPYQVIADAFHSSKSSISYESAAGLPKGFPISHEVILGGRKSWQFLENLPKERIRILSLEEAQK